MVVHNVRSAHNVGSILRTADAMAAEYVYLSGYTPYPHKDKDDRLPHIARRASEQISKTALGAEKSVSWQRAGNISKLIMDLKEKGFLVVALEQTPNALDLEKFKTDKNIALIVGREVLGIEKTILDQADIHLKITMLGRKESLNVSVAAAIALYHCRNLA